MRLFFVVLGLVTFATPANGAQNTKMVLSIPSHPLCATNGTCAVDAYKKGQLTISTSTKHGTNGVVFRAQISGALKGGVPADVPSVKVVLQITTNGADCQQFLSPAFPLKHGRGSIAFSAADTTPSPLTGSAGSLLLSCGVGPFFTADNGFSLFGLTAILFGR